MFLSRINIANNSNKSIDFIERKITTNTVDHINIKYTISKKLLGLLKKEFGKKVDLVSIEQYLNPSLNDILLYDGREIELNEGDKFH